MWMLAVEQGGGINDDQILKLKHNARKKIRIFATFSTIIKWI